MLPKLVVWATSVRLSLFLFFWSGLHGGSVVIFLAKEANRYEKDCDNNDCFGCFEFLCRA